MPTIRPVTDSMRLWRVTNLIAPEQLADIQSVDWLNVSWQRGPGQETWRRRMLDLDHLTVTRVNQYIQQQLPAINSALGTDYQFFSGQFWLDEPGFRVPIHTDGELPTAVQIYWVMPSNAYGTTFYRYKSRNSVEYQFLSRPNSGYILLNHKNPDGSQPLLWHGMLNTVPEGTYRLSSYWYLS